MRVWEPWAPRAGAAWALAVVLSACGGDDDASGSGGSGGAAGGTGATGGTSTSGGTGGLGGASGVGGSVAGAGGSSGSAGSAGSASGGSGGSAGSVALTERRVFVTSVEYTGALGGLSGADAKCGELAGKAGLGGSWVAWLSDASSWPDNRFVHSSLPYVLVGGSEIAKDWDDLVDGTLAVGIDRDETGTPLPSGANAFVWTATTYKGIGVTMNCNGYTDTTSFSPRGHAGATTSQWSIESPSDCAQTNRIYCFEK